MAGSVETALEPAATVSLFAIMFVLTRGDGLGRACSGTEQSDPPKEGLNGELAAGCPPLRLRQPSEAIKMQVAVSKQRVAAGAQRGAGLTEALGLPTLATMSAVWGNSENIYSLRVLPPVTRSRPRTFAVQNLVIIDGGSISLLPSRPT